jgi:hypothetical protein
MTESVVLKQLTELIRVKDAREALTEVIKGRFPEILTPDVERTINEQPSLDLMKSWHAAAVRAQSGEEFLKILKQ